MQSRTDVRNESAPSTGSRRSASVAVSLVMLAPHRPEAQRPANTAQVSPGIRLYGDPSPRARCDQAGTQPAGPSGNQLGRCSSAVRRHAFAGSRIGPRRWAAASCSTARPVTTPASTPIPAADDWHPNSEAQTSRRSWTVGRKRAFKGNGWPCDFAGRRCQRCQRPGLSPRRWAAVGHDDGDRRLPSGAVSATRSGCLARCLRSPAASASVYSGHLCSRMSGTPGEAHLRPSGKDQVVRAKPGTVLEHKYMLRVV